MGNTTQQIQKQLEFVQILQDKHFGQIQIYKNDEGVFIMKLDRNHVKGDLHQQTFRHIVEYTMSKENKYIIPIVHVKSHVENGLCLVYQRTSLFSEYYNHTLADMLQSKKVFEEPQLWFLFWHLLQLIVLLKQKQLAINLQLDRIFLTLKGFPCVSHYHVYSTQNTITCSPQQMPEMLAKTIIELVLGRPLEEDLETINQSKEIMASLGKVCAKYKMLGKMVKQLLTKEKNEQEIIESIEEMESRGAIRKATQVKLTKYRYVIPAATQPAKPVQTKENTNSLLQYPSKSSQSKSSQIVDTLKKQHKQYKPYEEVPSVEFKPKKQRNNSTASKKQLKEPISEIKQSLMNKKNMGMSREETVKLMTDFEKRKQDYKAQLERFQMRKEELLCQSEKENLSNSRPVMRQTQVKKSKGKWAEELKKKKTEPSHQNNKCR